jgi:hypothetical protein
MDRFCYLTDFVQHDFSAAQAIYVTHVIDFLKATPEYSSRKYGKS